MWTKNQHKFLYLTSSCTLTSISLLANSRLTTMECPRREACVSAVCPCYILLPPTNILIKKKKQIAKWIRGREEKKEGDWGCDENQHSLLFLLMTTTVFFSIPRFEHKIWLCNVWVCLFFRALMSYFFFRSYFNWGVDNLTTWVAGGEGGYGDIWL